LRENGCIGFRGGGNSGPEAGFDHVNVHNRDPWENEPMAMEEEGGGHRRHAFSRHSLYGGSR